MTLLVVEAGDKALRFNGSDLLWYDQLRCNIRGGGAGMTVRMTNRAALAAVEAADDGIYGLLLQHGSLEIGYYKPQGTDTQEPHEQDEVYIVQSGFGQFVVGNERRDFEAGEALFVPAGVAHRFEAFSEDFAAWVIFYGPVGGEET
jgi:mannose-6-phosphate isomerase-like protein (cupin superfamily)